MNPYHWRFLLGFLACAQFGDVPLGRPRGPSKWNDAAKLKMATQIRAVSPITNALTYREIAKLLIQEFPEDYKRVTEDHVYNRVRALKEIAYDKK
jgi:hypothetical protein